MADVEQGEVAELLDMVELTPRVLKSRLEGIFNIEKVTT